MRVHVNVSARIVELIDRERPPNISGNVATIVVDTIDRVPRGRPRSHVRIERGKRFEPRRIHRYPSATIALESYVSLVCAALDYLLPGSVLSSAVHAVFARRLPPSLDSVTAAR